MVGTALTIEREMEDAWNTRDASVSGKRKDSQSSSSSGKRHRASSSRGSQSHGHPGQGHMRVAGQARHMRVARSCRTYESCQSGGTDGVLPLSAAWTHEMGLPPETGIPGFWDITVPVSSRTGDDTVHSSTTWYRLEGLVSVSGCYTGTPHFTGRPERSEYG